MCDKCLGLRDMYGLHILCFMGDQPLVKILLSGIFKQKINVGLVTEKTIEFDNMWMIEE